MAFIVRIVMSQTPGLSELEPACDAAAWANARYIALERSRGREPPCCLDCAGVRYVPDVPSSTRLSISTGGDLLARRTASCDEVAAWVLGMRRANAGRDGLDPHAMGRVRLQRQSATVVHAVVELPDGSIIDATTDMRCADGTACARGPHG